MTASFAVIRSAHLSACLLVLCVCAFDRIVAHPLVRDGPSDVSEVWDRIARRIIMACLPVALVTGGLWLGMVACNMSDLPPLDVMRTGALRLVWTGTHFGRLWHWRGAFWLMTGLSAAPVFVVGPYHRAVRLTFIWATLLSAVLLCGSLALAGHGQTGADASFHLVADVTHLLVCALWPMGLLPFLLLIFHFRPLPDALGREITAMLTRRFSAMSLISVAVLGLTGVVNSWLLVGSWAGLIHSLYGKVLLLKLAGFAGMIALGAMNLTRCKPRLCADAGTDDSVQRAARELRRNVLYETILATAVMVLVGLLGLLPPAADALAHVHHH